MEIFIIILYGGILISLLLLPYILYLSVRALKIYIAKNTIEEPKPAHTRFEENPAKSDSKPL